LLVTGVALILALAVVALLLVGRRVLRVRSAPATIKLDVRPPDGRAPDVRAPDVRNMVRAWLVAAPDHAVTLQRMMREHGQLRARADAAEQELAPLRDRAVLAEQQCEELRQELSRRTDQLEELRKDWDEVTQRISQVLLDVLEKRHDEH
jgi:septal ring factor EnvC (AmiA/AmiB activator)